MPQGSFQSENGINFSQREGNHEFDGTNSRLRRGIAPRLEVLVDLPTYFAAARGQLNSGFTNVIPAIKWQIRPVPGKIDLSATLGAGLPTGTKAIAGPGVQPYVQFPWSWELGGGWGISGMVYWIFLWPRYAPAVPSCRGPCLQARTRTHDAACEGAAHRVASPAQLD